MNNILFLISSSEMGGAQRWVHDQVQILNNDFRVYIGTNQEGWLTTGIREESLFLHNGISRYLSLSCVLSLRKFIKEKNINIVVASSASAGVIGRLVSFVCCVPIVYVSHGWSSIYAGRYFKKAFILSEKILSLITNKVLCISEADYNKAIKTIGIAPEKLFLIENKVIPNKTPSKRASRINDRNKVLTVCRLAPPKRVDLLVKAFSNVDADLYIVGDGPEADKLRALVDGDNIHFLGEIQGFSRFSDYDLFCLISDSEGLPMSAIEAMGAGLPLLLSDVGGCESLVSSGNGVLVDNSVDNIADSICSALQDRGRMALLSERLFNEKYNLLNFSDKYIDFYMSLVEVK